MCRQRQGRCATSTDACWRLDEFASKGKGPTIPLFPINDEIVCASGCESVGDRCPLATILRQRPGDAYRREAVIHKVKPGVPVRSNRSMQRVTPPLSQRTRLAHRAETLCPLEPRRMISARPRALSQVPSACRALPAMRQMILTQRGVHRVRPVLAARPRELDRIVGRGYQHRGRNQPFIYRAW